MADAKLEVIVKLGDIDKVRDYILGLEETLQFYANPDNYEVTGDITTCSNPIILKDQGQRARDILKERL